MFDRFSNLRILKNTAPAYDFEDLCICFMIALETDLGPILVRFWTPKSFQNRTQEGPEGCWKSWSFLHAFGNLQKSIFGPTWPQLGPQDGPKLEPKWDPNRSKKGFRKRCRKIKKNGRFQSRLGIDFWPIFGSIFDRFRDDFLLNFDRCLCILLFAFQSFSIRFLCWFVIDFVTHERVSLLFCFPWLVLFPLLCFV